MDMKKTLFLPALLALWLASSGCSPHRIAVNKIGDALAGSGTTFASDDDPQLVRDAVPFSLKLIESLLDETPRHRGLLLAACRGFTQYAYAFIQQDADEMEDRDLAAANALRTRARGLYLRARNDCLRGLETRHPGIEKELRQDPKAAALKLTSAKEVPMIYWTASSWGAAIAVSKDSPDTVADQPIVEALIDRALKLDEQFDFGAIHGFLISYESARPGAKGDPNLRAKEHFDRAVELSEGKLASPFVSFAEAVCIGKQDRPGFEAALKQALAIDPSLRPEWRLENLVMQRRARWLLSRTEQLFLD
jgi:predicted anti-sigma-YlaC factor YlaD